MKIIVDMMGGDNAPLAVLEGAAQAVKEYGVQLIGVGNEALVRKTAAEHNIPLDGIELVNCTETIEMCDEPARAIRQKKDSSIVVGLNLLKEGKGDAFVSAGSTGALHVGASLIVRTLRGVKRPALATMVPAKQQAYLLLDCGANVECRPEMLAAFAVMGSCYVNKVEGRKNPSVALTNNGAEVGRVYRRDDGLQDYVDHLYAVGTGLQLNARAIVVDVDFDLVLHLVRQLIACLLYTSRCV